MKAMLWKMVGEDDGVLSFEWVLLVTLVTIGIVGGLAAVRDAIIDELGDFSQAAMAIDESYTITDPLLIVVHDPAGESGGANTSFVDAAIYEDCTRVTVGSVIQQQPELDTDS
jgi:Flp pilus assembly pilin Flp